MSDSPLLDTLADMTAAALERAGLVDLELMLYVSPRSPPSGLRRRPIS